MDVLLRPWRQAFDVYGRSRRSEFVLFMVQIGLIWVVTITAIAMLTPKPEPDGVALESRGIALLAAVVVLGFSSLVLGAIATIRRVHDFDQSGALALLVVVGGWLALLVFAIIPGTVGPNRHGLDPRGRAGDRVENVFS